MVCVCLCRKFRVRNVRWPSRHSGYVIIKQSIQAQLRKVCDSRTDRQSGPADELITCFLLSWVSFCLSVQCFRLSCVQRFIRQHQMFLSSHSYAHTSAAFESEALWFCSIESSHCSFSAQSRSMWDVVSGRLCKSMCCLTGRQLSSSQPFFCHLLQK